jgi:hypothetical protein
VYCCSSCNEYDGGYCASLLLKVKSVRLCLFFYFFSSVTHRSHDLGIVRLKPALAVFLCTDSYSSLMNEVLQNPHVTYIMS